MQPIVNPWLFFVADLVTSLSIACVLITIIMWAFGLVYVMDGDDKKDINQIRKGKKCFIIGTTILVVGLLIPSKQTLLEMYVAKNITYDRIEKLHKVTKRDIIDIIRGILKENK